MLMPKKVKHRKWHKGRRRNTGVATSRNTVAFGSLGLRSLGHGWISSRQIEAARRVITQYTKKGGKVWIRIFPDKPITKKGSETPMGKGKGGVDHYVAIVKPGTVMFEIDGIGETLGHKALELASYKLSVKTAVVAK